MLIETSMKVSGLMIRKLAEVFLPVIVRNYVLQQW
jgi:hypothetical protein